MAEPRRIAIVVHAVVPGDPRIRRQSDALLDAGHEVDILALRHPAPALHIRDRSDAHAISRTWPRNHLARAGPDRPGASEMFS